MLNDLPTERVTAALRFSLHEAKLSRERFAKKVGFSASAVNRRLADETPMTLDDLHAFADALGYEVTVTFTPVRRDLAA